MAPVKQKPMIGKVLASSRGALSSVGLFSCFINILMLSGPLFMLQIYDRVLTSRSVPTLLALLVLVMGLYTFLGLLEFVRQRVLVRIGLRFDEQVGAAGFISFVTLPLRSGPRAEAVQPIRDIDQLRQFFAGQGITALFDMPWLPIFLGVVFLLHPMLGLIGLAGSLILFILALGTDLATTGPLAEAGKQQGLRHSIAEAARRNAEALKGMGMTTAVVAVWEKVNQTYIQAHARASDRAGGFTITTKVFRLFLQSLVLAVGAYLAIQNEITPGTMIAASIITARALQPVEQAVGQWRSFVSTRQSYARLKNTLALEGEPPSTTLPPPQKELRVENLFVAPPGSQTVTLKDVSFGLAAGAGLGVIGPTGSGKSTLVRALVGVWPPARGAVRLDGAPLDQWPEAQIALYVGYLPQDVELFAGTIADNIARFDPERTSELIIAAAKQAAVHEMILRLADGYDTQLGEGGAILSAGQRQRVGLARALYRDPFLVVLDEPNSNLDGAGDQALAAAVRGIRARGGIVVIVAHRPGAVAAVDTLLFIEEGAAKLMGPKEKVLKELEDRHRKATAAKTDRGDILAAEEKSNG